MDKAKVYENLYTTLKEELPQDQTQREALLCKRISEAFPNFSFVGFYCLKEDKLLHIGEYVSADIFPCATIEIGKGQCGLCVKERKTQIMKDVKEVENYIACDTESQLEIVVPCFSKGAVISVLDIDSPNIGDFDEADDAGLTKLIELLYTL